jgi:peptidyl-prolyl cis-trans isomerase A (cyclophilin A)
MNNRIKLLCVFSLVVVLISGCNPSSTWKKQERSQIDSYVKSLGDTAYVLEPSGLYYIELQAGTGRSPVLKDTVYFTYTGMFLDRQVFDSNVASSTPYGAIIGNYEIIPGLDEGLRLMKEGGKARFLTPSSLAYGQAGVWGAIPGYTPLIWELTLLTVKPGSK